MELPAIYDLNVACVVEGGDVINNDQSCQENDSNRRSHADGSLHIANDDLDDDLNRIDDHGVASAAITAPYVGMKFESAGQMMRHCHEYGKAIGFQIKIRSSDKMKKSVVKYTTHKDGSVTEARSDMQQDNEYKRVRLVCSKSGTFESRSRNPHKATRTCKTGCEFKVNASVCPNGFWKLTKVSLDHSHTCVPEYSKLMPNFRHISKENETTILSNKRANVPLMQNLSNKRANVPLMQNETTILSNKRANVPLMHDDFVAMRRYFESMSFCNSDFFYMYDTDESGTLRNVFWADGRSRAAYHEFGDVVSFDTTNISNRYNMLVASFIGVNHHGQSILLGCALIAGKETQNFVWLFRAWMVCMSNKAPKAILTDQCEAIGNTIAEVFPHSQHRWSIWHMMRNAKTHLNRHSEWKLIKQGLKDALHDSLTIGEFEHAWREWVTTYGLDNYDWCRDMYLQRSRWVPAFFKDEFWAGMSSTQSNEGRNAFFKGYLNKNTTLKQYVEQYGLALAKSVEEEEFANFRSMDSPIQCFSTKIIFERFFQKLYTTNKFLEFQREVKDMMFTNATKVHDDGEKVSYDVTMKKPVDGQIKRKKYVVTMDRGFFDIKCDCKNFEFKGILCSHSLSVFHVEELTFVPERYILDRWRKDLPREYLKVPVSDYSLLNNKKSVDLKRYEELRRLFESLAVVAMKNEELYHEVNR